MREATKRLNNVIDEIINEYESGKSIDYLSKKYNFDKSTIYKRMQKLNAKVRNKTFIVNEYYFNVIDTEEKAYWLGFIYADGNVDGKCRDRIRLCLHTEDVKHLEKFKECLDYNGNIYYSKYNMCELTIASKQLKDDLTKHGCIPNKTYDLVFPITVPKELIHHFIRGYFDGDGCITLSKSKQIIISFVGTKKLLEKFVLYFYNNCDAKKNKIITDAKKDGNKNIDQLCYGGNYLARNILNWLYKDANIYLNRKYNRYIEFTNKYKPKMKPMTDE